MNHDRKGLMYLAGGALVGLIAIALAAMLLDVKDASLALVGTVAGLLGAYAQSIVTVIRAAWTDERTGALTDQLAKSAPTPETVDRTTVEGSPQ